MRRLILFNHYHRGDLFTHKEFARQIKNELSDVQLEYWHFNHPKVNRDLGITLTGFPNNISNWTKFEKQDNSFLVNTWIGIWGEIFDRHGGVNLLSLTESWTIIFEEINKEFGSNLSVRADIRSYLPRIDYSKFNLKNIESFINTNKSKKVLICNGFPMSNQSFNSDLSAPINLMAFNHKDISFICTRKFNTNYSNIFFTDDIIQDNDVYHFNAPWHDREVNTCDLNEISYLSTKCDLIIGKNSGPFVFCETYDNLMDRTKRIISFSRGSNESMSNAVNPECEYKLVTDHDMGNIVKVMNEAVSSL